MNSYDKKIHRKLDHLTEMLGLSLLDQTQHESRNIVDIPSLYDSISDYCKHLNEIPVTYNFDKLIPEKERIVFLSHLNQMKQSRKITQWYGITLTFNPRFHQEDPLWLHKYIHDKMKKSIVLKKAQYIFYPEYTNAGVLHYHGLVLDLWPLEFVRFKTWWLRSFGFNKPEMEVRNKDRWIKYCIKQRNRHKLWTIEKLTIKPIF